MSPERLQEGLEWTWRQSYRWASLATRATAAPWAMLPLWVSLNLGYRYYARHLHEKTWPVYRAAAERGGGHAEINGVPASGEASAKR
jgi:hypothetical protein